MTATLAFPGDDPTLRYQAEGLAAMTAALELNGPLAPVPYITDASEPAESVRRAALDVPLRVCVITSRPYLDWVLGNRPTRPTA